MSGLLSRIPKPGQRRRQARGLFRELDTLTAANRANPDPETERRLLRVRHLAFDYLDTDPRAETVAPATGTRPIEQGLPVIDASSLTAAKVRQGILSHGSVHVRGLLDPDRVARMKSGIDRTFSAAQAFSEAEEQGRAGEWLEQEESAFYHRFRPLPGYSLGGGRNWNKNNTAIWAADSPRVMFDHIDTLERLGVADVINEYLGERAAISMNKTVLRRVLPTRGGADWHQDGAFLGADIRSLNVWLALTDCGVTAPGMDIVARRLDGIVPTGGEGANFDWSVAPADAERAAGEGGIVTPEFKAGDALLFDHLMLHRTASNDSMTDPRYAIETWFFAPSAYPAEQVPLVL
jgi:hypothetical protein